MIKRGWLQITYPLYQPLQLGSRGILLALFDHCSWTKIEHTLILDYQLMRGRVSDDITPDQINFSRPLTTPRVMGDMYSRYIISDHPLWSGHDIVFFSCEQEPISHLKHWATLKDAQLSTYNQTFHVPHTINNKHVYTLRHLNSCKYIVDKHANYGMIIINSTRSSLISVKQNVIMLKLYWHSDLWLSACMFCDSKHIKLYILCRLSTQSYINFNIL